MAGQAVAVAAAQAMKLRITMPRNVLIPDPPRVAIWDSVRSHARLPVSATLVPEVTNALPCSPHGLQKEQRWSDDGITEQGYDTVTRVLTVHTIKLAPMAVVQPRFVDFPFQAWSVEPTGDHKAVYSLRTQRFGVKIEVRGVWIGGSGCRHTLSAGNPLACR